MKMSQAERQALHDLADMRDTVRELRSLVVTRIAEATGLVQTPREADTPT